MVFSFAFDMLLHNDAKQLWQEFCQINESISNEDAEKWFLENFTTAKTLVDNVAELSSMKQKMNEKYQTYEIRVKNLVKEIFEKKRSIEDVTRLFITNGLRSEK